MKKTKGPTRSKFRVLKQICNLIPGHLVPKLARETECEDKARSFTPWSHVISMLYAQLTHSIGLNDVCDALQNHKSELAEIRGAVPPSRNGLSNANKVRPADLAEKLFWSLMEHLPQLAPGFGGRQKSGFPHRFRRVIHVVDSTVLELVVNCIDWAKHRRRKAAAKCHMRLDLQSFLPRFVVIDTAGEHDNSRARELCSGVKAGEIVIFDKGYLDFKHLGYLETRGVFWVTRAKDNLQCRVLENLPLPSGQPNILEDQLIALTSPAGAGYPSILRRVKALVEVDGEMREMVFLTNNTSWSPSSIVDLYRYRWQIEVFFKQIKQTLQLADFLGYSANAVRWQVWSALIVYLLLRFFSYVHGWAHSFTRLFTVIRAVLWKHLDLKELLRGYGTACGHYRYLAQPEQAYFAGI